MCFYYDLLVSTRSETDREMKKFLLCSAETCNEIASACIFIRPLSVIIKKWAAPIYRYHCKKVLPGTKEEKAFGKRAGHHYGGEKTLLEALHGRGVCT